MAHLDEITRISEESDAARVAQSLRLLVGAQTRTAEARAALTNLPGAFDAGVLPPPDGGDAGVSAVYLCDITDMPTASELGFADLSAACGRYTAPEGVACIGAVNGLIENDGVLRSFSTRASATGSVRSRGRSSVSPVSPRVGPGPRSPAKLDYPSRAP